LCWPFSDLLASVDAVIGKPGYGTFVEAACQGTPMLYAARPDWPEQEPLVDWLLAHGRATLVSDEALRSGDLAGALQALWCQPAKPAVWPTGADEVARQLQLRYSTTASTLCPSGSSTKAA
jgi:UDP-N-acetylglucosamine:LPS N-acetylglucosamine transferase